MRDALGSDALGSDQVGAATLERIAQAPAFNRWMYDRLKRWIGDRVLEIGSGIGNMSQFFVDRESVMLTDTEEQYRARLRERFGHLPQVTVQRIELPALPKEVPVGAWDTIVCLNVLEHIEDDRASLRAMRTLLVPGGRLVLLVPALQALYGSLDRALGHYRRYTPRVLRERYEGVGFRVRHIEWFNAAGIPGWWFVGRVLKRELIPTASLALYDALVPVFRLERLLPWRVGQSLIAIGERTT